MAQKIGEVMTHDPVSVGPATSLVEVARRMRDEDVGAIVVVDTTGRPTGIVTDRDIVVRAVVVHPDDGSVVGIVSLGDLAIERDPESALADISAAPPNN